MHSLVDMHCSYLVLAQREELFRFFRAVAQICSQVLRSPELVIAEALKGFVTLRSMAGGT